MPSPNQELLRTIPSVDVLLQDADLQRHTTGVPRLIVTEAIRSAVQQARTYLKDESAKESSPQAIRRMILTSAAEHIRDAMKLHYRKVINATGIILHTGLGRAVLCKRAICRITESLSGYSLLQTDIESGRRSKRDGRIEWLLQRLTGAEAATVVNNNAAATMIVLNTIGKGREIIVSRGQLVEIGGSFRLPEVMEASGAKLVEVGTTNKTHAHDYENAITENTAAIMRIHPSNYKITGFTSEVPLAELVRIAHAHELVLIDDLGAGALMDFSRFGFEDQPSLLDSIQAGADITTSSADKLMGASQGGIILGRRELIAAIRKNPLARIVRVGKLTLAALETTLMLFFDESLALGEIPTLQMLRRDLSEIAEQAKMIASSLRDRHLNAEVKVIDGFSQMGSGSLPGENLPTKLVAIYGNQVEPEVLAGKLRRYDPPIFTRLHKEQVLIDPRTLLEGEDRVLIKGLIEVLESGE